MPATVNNVFMKPLPWHVTSIALAELAAIWLCSKRPALQGLFKSMLTWCHKQDPTVDQIHWLLQRHYKTSVAATHPAQ